MSYVDIPDRKQKHPHYEHRTAKLDKKDNEFTSKKFHQIRKVSTHKKLLKSFGRIAMCLNDKTLGDIPTSDLDKVCFILVNDYEDEENELGVGPLNDGYLIGLNHHRLGFKVFYLYNPNSQSFKSFLGFFMRNTTEALTVFYSGSESSESGVKGIEFNNESLSRSSIGEIISEHLNCKAHVMFLTDCVGGGSVFDIEGIQGENLGTNMISLYISKQSSPDSKESKRSHGIFTYYFCKITSECPNITPKRLIERISPSILRFNETLTLEITNKYLADSPIFFN